MYLLVKARQIHDDGSTPRLSIQYISTNRYNGWVHQCNMVLCANTYNILANYTLSPFEYELTEAGAALGIDFLTFVDSLNPLVLATEFPID